MSNHIARQLDDDPFSYAIDATAPIWREDFQVPNRARCDRTPWLLQDAPYLTGFDVPTTDDFHHPHGRAATSSSSDITSTMTNATTPNYVDIGTHVLPPSWIHYGKKRHGPATFAPGMRTVRRPLLEADNITSEQYVELDHLNGLGDYLNDDDFNPLADLSLRGSFNGPLLEDVNISFPDDAANRPDFQCQCSFPCPDKYHGHNAGPHKHLARQTSALAPAYSGTPPEKEEEKAPTITDGLERTSERTLIRRDPTLNPTDDRRAVLTPPNGCYACKTCKRAFANSYRLERHARVEKHRQYECDMPDCDKKYCRRDLLRRHILTSHGSPSLHTCSYCGPDEPRREFRRKDHLSQHIRNCHPQQEPYQELGCRDFTYRQTSDFHQNIFGRIVAVNDLET